MAVNETKAKASKASKTKAKASKASETKAKASKASKASETKAKASKASKPQTYTLPGLPAPEAPRLPATVESRALVANAPSVALAPLDATTYAHEKRTPKPEVEPLTREAWLMLVLNEVLRELFKKRAGIILPDNIRVSIGFPSTARSSKKGKVIGEVHSHMASEDKHFEVFIHPGLDTVARSLDVLIHELVHIAVGLNEGHGKAFKRVATRVGLVGKMTATVAGEELSVFLNKCLTMLPSYPGATLHSGETNAPKKQNTRMLKAECNCCGYVIRLSRKWASVGLPTCMCGGEFVLEVDISDLGE